MDYLCPVKDSVKLDACYVLRTVSKGQKGKELTERRGCQGNGYSTVGTMSYSLWAEVLPGCYRNTREQDPLCGVTCLGQCNH